MAAELIITQLRGSADEREAAYVELFRREAEHNASTGSFSAPAMREEKLMALRSRATMEELDEDAVGPAMKAGQPKAAPIELLRARRPSAEGKAVADVC